SNWQTALLTIFITAGGILYTERLKRIPVLGWKTYYVSFFWAILILVIPFFYVLDTVTPYLYLVLFIFIRGLVNTTFSDIKDIESDRARNIKTFPAYWGKEKTLYILQVINLISLVPLVVGVINSDLPILALVLGLTVVNGVYYLT